MDSVWRYTQSQFQIFLGNVNFECYLPAIKYWVGTCKICGYKTLYPIRAPLCFRPHKSGAVHGRVNLFLFVGTQDRWIQFQIMSILGINGGTGIPVYRKKCGVTGQDGQRRYGRSGWKLFWNYDSGCVLWAPRVSRLVSGNIQRLQPFKLHRNAILL